MINFSIAVYFGVLIIIVQINVKYNAASCSGSGIFLSASQVETLPTEQTNPRDIYQVVVVR